MSSYFYSTLNFNVKKERNRQKVLNLIADKELEDARTDLRILREICGEIENPTIEEELSNCIIQLEFEKKR